MTTTTIELGKVHRTTGIIDLIADAPFAAEHLIAEALEQHRNGQWGDIDGGTAAVMDAAARTATAKLWSQWDIAGTPIWIITDQRGTPSCHTIISMTANWARGA